MNICIPIESDQGLSSRISRHFSSAPAFAIVDTESMQFRAISNSSRGDGACRTLALLSGQGIQRLLVSRIGEGALNKCQAGGFNVLRTSQATVREALDAFKAGMLSEVVEGHPCARRRARLGHECGQGQGEACRHRHRHRRGSEADSPLGPASCD
jgi:predicted Fe-Mo cluster-binding NifX family protein